MVTDDHHNTWQDAFVIQSVSTTVFWGGDLTDEEVSELSAIAGVEIEGEAKVRLRQVYFEYRALCAAQDTSISVDEIKQRLREIDRHATKLAEALGGHPLDFDEFFSHRRPKKHAQPRTQIGQEIEHRVELELVHMDIRFRKEHGLDPRFSEISQLNTAWELAQIARAARAAIAALPRSSGGRPKSGAERLVTGVFEVLDSVGARPTCGYSDARGDYTGSFPQIVPWLHGLPLPVRESAGTLCKYASKIPKAGRNPRRGRGFRPDD